MADVEKLPENIAQVLENTGRMYYNEHIKNNKNERKSYEQQRKNPCGTAL